LTTKTILLGQRHQVEAEVVECGGKRSATPL